jgi:hypothetical protein
MLIPVEQCPHLMNRAVIPALPGIAGNRYGSVSHFKRMQAILPAVSGVDVKLVLLLEVII